MAEGGKFISKNNNKLRCGNSKGSGATTKNIFGPKHKFLFKKNLKEGIIIYSERKKPFI